MKLENALNLAEKRERLVFHIVWVSFGVAGTLFILGYQVIDPSASITTRILGVVYGITLCVAVYGLLFYYARFRPKVKDIQDQIRDARILALQGEISELRKQIATTGFRSNSD